MNKPSVYMLIGVPGSGKSTYVGELEASNFVYVSSDYFIDKFACRMGKTYDEVFKEVAPRAMRLMNRRVQTARRNQRTIVWDQTNTSRKSRAKKLLQLSEYNKIAVFFETPPDVVLDKRLASRPGKEIPDYVMRTMKENLEYPTLEEGFDVIMVPENFNL
jgi:predicted kinase